MRRSLGMRVCVISCLLLTNFVQLSVHQTLHVAILLPLESVPLSAEPCLTIRHIWPAVRSALAKINRTEQTSAVDSLTVQTHFVNSRCSDIDGPLAAVDLYLQGRVHVFFGPCCKYVLSPVARYNRRWGLPIVTVGGLSPAFANHDEFPYLTRAMASYDKLSQVLISVFTAQRWRKVGLLWHNHLQEPQKGRSECTHLAEGVTRHLYRGRFPDPHRDSFDEKFAYLYDWGAIFNDIRMSCRSKF